MSKNEGEEISQEFVDSVAADLSSTLSNIAGKHRIPSYAYVLITRNTGSTDRVFTAPFSVRYLTGGTEAGPLVADRLTDIGLLYENIGLSEHLSAVMDHNPEAALIFDEKTVVAASKSNPNLTFVNVVEGHCMLIGLRDNPVDAYIESDATISSMGDGTEIRYT